jgi:acyl-CoA thioester hydrolase
MYHHVNNSVYYHLFDSVVNSYLIQHCALDPKKSSHIGLVVHSQCDYLAPTEFPAVLVLALKVIKLGTSSVTYEIAVFERGQVMALGQFVHVFVDRESRKPTKEGMPGKLREGLGRILAEPSRL